MQKELCADEMPFEKPLEEDLLTVLAQQIENCDEATLRKFLSQAADLIPENCTPLVRMGEIILRCTKRPDAQNLWRDHSRLIDRAREANRLTILCGDSRYSISTEALQRRRIMNQSLAPNIQSSHCTYQQLIAKVAGAEFPTFVIEIPRGWHWGQPQRVILTSAQVTGFSGRKAPNWHGDDVTLLYDRPEFERIHDRLMRELETTPSDRIARIEGIEYKSYTAAGDRESLARGQEALYNSDLEIFYITDLDMIVRVCYCKHRQLL